MISSGQWSRPKMPGGAEAICDSIELYRTQHNQNRNIDIYFIMEKLFEFHVREAVHFTEVFSQP
jgi:hypothetical protein